MIEFFYRVDVFAEAEQHGHVSVVTAGVHLAGMGGHVVACVGFRHRQSIHVGTEGEGICGSPVEPGADAGAAKEGQFTVQLFQNRKEICFCLWKIAIDLRDLMKLAAVCF